MPLFTGDKLGPYEILGLIGKGGMGEVYRGRDTKLKRDVAIKILPEAFARDAERMARFQREAEVLASLNHPNIAAIYGLEDRALVMELVEGESPKGPLAFDDAWHIASQIAAALEYAHDKGVVHRDLKPANVKVTPEGAVKLLDFGLAKAFSTQTETCPLGSGENSPTLTIGATEAGMILGTAAYMSPEQARGKTVDKRADIWSFGVVLYELLTAERLFTGEDATETLALVITSQPDFGKAPPLARQLLKECLQKDPKLRLRDIGDARRLLREGDDRNTEKPRHNALLPWVATVIVLSTIAVLGWVRTPATAPSLHPNLALTILPPEGTRLRPRGQSISEVISPDGSMVVFIANGKWYVRRLDSLTAQPVIGSDGAGGQVLWSPDSKSIAFGQVQLMRVRLPDGAPEVISAIPFVPRGAAWSEKGTILFASLGAKFFYEIPATGGEPKRLEAPSLRPGHIYNPQFLRGGEDFLFLLLPSESDEAEVYLASLRDGKISKPVFLFKNDTAALYTPAGGGRILFVRNDNLYSQKLDLKARKVEGNPELVQQGVASAVVGRSANVSVSESGTIIFRPGIAALSQIVTFDRNGTRSGTTGPFLPANYVGLSPDETRLAAGSEAGSWLLEPDRPGRLSLGGRYLGRVWFPDSLRAIGVQGDQLLERSVVGPGEIHEIATVKEVLNPQDVSPDGKFLLFDLLNASLATVRLDLPLAGRGAVPVAQTAGIQQARFSPDGRWLLYPSGRLVSNNAGLFVQPFPGPGARKQIANSGTFSYWRRDGKEIVYFDNGQIWSIRVDAAGADLRFGVPKPLFKVVTPAGITTASKPLAISRDGSKIYFLQSGEQPEPDVIHVRTAAIR